ncbi:MAG: DUF1624 domain-containing protein [Methanobacteriaceae archaeon]|nr:DUF1624 domain-containing protein [Methanobacteriaceae archaeon]
MDLNKRFWEIDVLRGLAIVMMVSYHLIFDLAYFGIITLNVTTGFWWYFARITAFIFLFLVGVSLTLSHSRAQLIMGDHEKKSLFPKYFKRGVKIFSMGLLVTLATWLLIPQEFIVFGVLHFIGLAIILEYPFLNKKQLNLILGTVFIMAGFILTFFTATTPWFIWLGLKPAGFITVDYFPLLPWLGVVSIGLFAGNILYKDYKRQYTLPDLSKNIIIRIFSFLGRNSLLIYLIHQPILILILYLFGVVDIGNLFLILHP